MDTAERAQLNPAEFCNGKRCGPVRTDRSLSHYRNSHISYASSDTFYPNAQNGDQSHSINFGPTLKRIFSIHHYREGGWHNSSM